MQVSEGPGRGAGRRCGFAVPVSGGAGLAVRGSGKVEAPGSGPATARLSGHDCLAGSVQPEWGNAEGCGRCRAVEVTGLIDRGRGGRAGTGTTPRMRKSTQRF